MGKNRPSNPLCPAMKHPSPHNSGKTQGWPLCLPRTRPGRGYPNSQYLSCEWVAELSVPLEQPGQNFTKLQSGFSPSLNHNSRGSLNFDPPPMNLETSCPPWQTTLPPHQSSHFSALFILSYQESLTQDFPGSLVVKTPNFQCKGHKFNPCLGT